jgi:hypothetical protein
VSPFTESLDPIKAYECLAVGRPTVATPIAGFRGLPAPVVVAKGESFIAEVANALAGSSTVVNGGLPTWPARAMAFAEALQKAREAKVRRASKGFVDEAEIALVRLLPALK